MLIGEFQHSLEEKGRLAIPKGLRKRDEEEISSYVITKGFEQCLFMYPQRDWEEKIVAKMSNLNLGNKSAREFKRFIFGSAAEVVPDAQGRISLPANLRQYAGIEKEVVISGVQDHIELWDQTAWQRHMTAVEAESEKFAGEMGDLGI